MSFASSTRLSEENVILQDIRMLMESLGILESLGIDGHCSFSKDCNASSVFVCITEAILMEKLEKIIRKPIERVDYIHNVQIVVERIESLIGLSLNFLSAGLIVDGDLGEIRKLLDILRTMNDELEWGRDDGIAVQHQPGNSLNPTVTRVPSALLKPAVYMKDCCSCSSDSFSTDCSSHSFWEGTHISKKLPGKESDKHAFPSEKERDKKAFPYGSRSAAVFVVRGNATNSAQPAVTMAGKTSLRKSSSSSSPKRAEKPVATKKPKPTKLLKSELSALMQYAFQRGVDCRRWFAPDDCSKSPNTGEEQIRLGNYCLTRAEFEKRLQGLSLGLCAGMGGSIQEEIKLAVSRESVNMAMCMAAGDPNSSGLKTVHVNKFLKLFDFPEHVLPQAPTPVTTWQCKACTLENEQTNKVCAACWTPKKQTVAPGTCASCSYANSPSNRTCEMCSSLLHSEQLGDSFHGSVKEQSNEEISSDLLKMLDAVGLSNFSNFFLRELGLKQVYEFELLDQNNWDEVKHALKLIPTKKLRMVLEKRGLSIQGHI